MPVSQNTGAARMVNARRLRVLVSIAIIGLLAWFLLDALEREIGKAEEMSANMVLGQLRSALVIKGAEVILGQKDRLEDHEGMNPFGLLEHQWASYTGLCELHKMKSATWCFWQLKQKDTVKRSKGWLIYNPRQPVIVDGRAISAGELAGWTVTMEFADHNHNRQLDINERSTGFKLVPVTVTEGITEALGAKN